MQTCRAVAKSDPQRLKIEIQCESYKDVIAKSDDNTNLMFCQYNLKCLSLRNANEHILYCV